jgi:hypothetical protein
MQQHCVGDAEYGSAGADAKRNCDHTGDGEYGTLSQRAERIYQVFGKHGFLNSLDQRMGSTAPSRKEQIISVPRKSNAAFRA